MAFKAVLYIYMYVKLTVLCWSHAQDVSSQPCSQSELHVVDDTDETDGDAADEAGMGKHAKRAKVRQRTTNQNRKGVRVCAKMLGFWCACIGSKGGCW